jgi:hypothetical protein
MFVLAGGLVLGRADGPPLTIPEGLALVAAGEVLPWPTAGTAFALFPESATFAEASPVTLTSAIPAPAARAGTMTAR